MPCSIVSLECQLCRHGLESRKPSNLLTRVHLASSFCPAPKTSPTEIFRVEGHADAKTIQNRFYLPYRVAHSYAHIQISMQCPPATDAAETCATTTKPGGTVDAWPTARSHVISAVSPHFAPHNLLILILPSDQS